MANSSSTTSKITRKSAGLPKNANAMLKGGKKPKAKAKKAMKRP